MRRNPVGWPATEVVRYDHGVAQAAKPAVSQVANLRSTTRLKQAFALLSLVLGFHVAVTAAERLPAYVTADAEIKVGNFSLQDHTGKGRELYRQDRARAVVLMFTMTGCPIAQKSIPKIKALRDQFDAKGVVFWLVDSNAADDLASIGAEAKAFGVDVPILLDRAQTVARSLGVTRTAEVVCIQPKTWKVFYRGAIDDQLGYGTEKRQASHAYLENALESFLAGTTVTPVRTEAKGCRFQFER